MNQGHGTRHVASIHRFLIFQALRSLPHDDAFLGHLVTKKAKELGLVSSDKKNLKGNTIQEWSESLAVDGRNTPNAWACTAAAHVLVEYGKRMSLSDEGILALSYYFSPSEDEDVFFQSKAFVCDSLLPSPGKVSSKG